MGDFRSILWKRLAVRAGGFEVLSLELHRHLPDFERMGSHAHPYWQALVYLSGRGVQEFGGRREDAPAGTLVLLPPRVRHAYHRLSRQPALCLVMAFRTRELPVRRAALRQLTALDLARIRTALAAMVRARGEDDKPAELLRAAVALEMLEILLRAAGTYPRPARRGESAILQRLTRLLADPRGDRLKLSALAGELGCGRDALSRRVREETGLTLGQLRDRQRVERARRALRRTPSIGEAAFACGFHDQNYFARWFRKQTGLSPSAWLRTMG